MPQSHLVIALRQQGILRGHCGIPESRGRVGLRGVEEVQPPHVERADGAGNRADSRRALPRGAATAPDGTTPPPPSTDQLRAAAWLAQTDHRAKWMPLEAIRDRHYTSAS